MGDWTAEDEAELQRLERQQKELDAGQVALQRHTAARAPTQTRPPAQQSRPFSIYRATVGALRDATQGIVDTVADIGSGIFSRNVPASAILPGAMGVVVDAAKTLAPQSTDTIKGVIDSKQAKAARTLPTLEGEERAGTAEKVVRGIGSFLIPYAGAAKAVGVARATGLLGRVGRGALAGGITDFSQADPVSGNMANFIKDTFGLDNGAIDAIASDPDDDGFENRAKAALAGAPLGIASDAVFEAGAKAFRAYRAWKGTAEEASAAVNAARAKHGLDPKARNLPLPANDVNPTAAGTVDRGSLNRDLVTGNEFTKPGPEDAKFTNAANDNPGGAKRAFNPETDSTVPPRAEPQNFEDVVDYIKRNIGDHELAGGDVARFAENLLFGDPENALAKIGIDPAKLDFSAYDDPDLLGRLQKGMAELYETYASKLGRSNIRVTEEATAKAARALATTPDVLKDLHGSTTNLAEELTAGRMFIGAHAHRLLADADKAAEEIIKGGAGEAWDTFMQSFHRHAYYLGVVRGAGSEVGRALRSLQMLAKSKTFYGKAAQKQAGKVLVAAAEQNAGEQATQGAKGFLEGASAYADKFQTDAEKLGMIRRLTAMGGDVADLTREVRKGNMTTMQRLDNALKETMGNLFGIGTASYNVLAGGAMLGSRVMTRLMSTAMRMAMAVGGGREAGTAARAALMDTWAYTHGIVASFGEAYQNTLRVLEKEGGSEIALNANHLGLDKLAVKMEARVRQASAELGRNSYERSDVQTYRDLAVLPDEARALDQMTRELPGPKFFTEGLRALVRIGGAALNAAGSLSRSGTILFINLPDQFVGTLAARAGAYSEGVRQAASEAAELGLEGKELSQFLKARTVQLVEGNPAETGWHPDGFEAGQRETVAAAGEVEARQILFQDDLDTDLAKAMSFGMTRVPLLHFAIPFVKTPMRILERTAIDFTPLGLLKDRVRQAIVAGGPARDEALARMSLGITAVSMGLALAEDRTIVGSDGGYVSSARLTRPSYSLKIGDDNYEFSRIDPFGTLLGFGADMRRFYHDIADDPDHDSTITNAIEGMVWATTANILSKTWLTGLRNLTDLAGATSNEDANTRLSKFLSSTAVRFVPGSGVQRGVEAAMDPYLRQAISYQDGLVKASLGGGTLPERRDPLLGRPVPLDGLTRIIGVRGGPGADAVDDPVGAEMERLSFQVPASKKKLEGVSLTAQQFSRFLELKGQVMKKPETGLTLEQSLAALIRNPDYQQLNDRQRVMAVREEMKGYARLATDQLLKEDKDFAYKALQQEVFDDVLNKQGGTSADANQQLQQFAKQLGLGPAK